METTMTQTNYLDVAFNSDEEEGTPAVQLLPMDRYTAEIVHASAGTTKNGRGYSVNLMWKVCEGDYDGWTVFQTCLLQHDNPDVMKWGRQRFKDVLSAVGVSGEVTDLSVLYDKPAKIVVKVKEDKTGQYQPKNEVTRVLSLAATRPYAPIFKKDDPISTGNGGATPELNDRIPF
jgi:hypothetical protein